MSGSVDPPDHNWGDSSSTHTARALDVLGDIAAKAITMAMLTAALPRIAESFGVGDSTLPFYLGAGIPLEGVVLLKAVDAIPDIFKTLLNVTADMTVATVVAAGVAYGVTHGDVVSVVEPA